MQLLSDSVEPSFASVSDGKIVNGDLLEENQALQETQKTNPQGGNSKNSNKNKRGNYRKKNKN